MKKIKHCIDNNKKNKLNDLIVLDDFHNVISKTKEMNNILIKFKAKNSIIADKKSKDNI